MKKFKEYIEESITDHKRKTLSRQIFDYVDTNRPAMKDEVIHQIKQGLKQFEDISKPTQYYVIGSILTHRYRDDADIDINVFFDIQDNVEETHIKLRERMPQVNGKPFGNTKHVINYFAMVDFDKFQNALENADAIYDINEKKFIKVEDVKEFDITKYLSKFHLAAGKIDKMKGELTRDFIDYQELANLSPDEFPDLKAKLQEKILELETSIIQLVDLYQKYFDKRNAIFSRQLTSQEKKKYSTPHELPYNIVYKMLEKYQYFSFIKKLKKIIGDDQKLDHEELENLKKALVTNVGFVEESTDTPSFMIFLDDTEK